MASGNGDDLELDDPGAGGSFVLAPREIDAAAGVFLRVVDENDEPVTDASVFVIADDSNGNIVPDNSEILLAETGTTAIPIRGFEGVGVLRLEVERAGFFDGGGRYELTSGEILDVKIVLTSDTANSDAIRVATGSGNLADGPVGATALSDNDQGTVLTSINIPQGLDITSFNGESLNDDITISIVHYDSEEVQALSTFPVGFDLVLENIDEVNTPFLEGTVPSESLEPVSSRVFVQTLGFSGIEIVDTAGRKAEDISDNFDLRIKIASAAVNLVTSNPTVVGDQVQIISFNTDTANWTYERTEFVESDGQGGLQVSFPANHLTVYAAVQLTQASCQANINVTLASNDGQQILGQPIDVTLTGTETIGNGYLQSRRADSGSAFSYRIPEEIPLNATFSTPFGDSVDISGVTLNGLPYTGGEFDPCGLDGQVGDGGDGTQNIEFVIALNTPLADFPTPIPVTADINVELLCTNGVVNDPIPLPGVLAFLDTEFDRVGSVTNQNGFVSLSGFAQESDPQAILSVFYGGLSQTVNIPFDTGVTSESPVSVDESFVFESNACTAITGVITTGITGITGGAGF